MTAGISAYFTFAILVLGIASATGHRELGGAPGALTAFGAWIVTMLAALGVNDWLSRRYPPGARRDSSSDEA